jgi:hypothetical protein
MRLCRMYCDANGRFLNPEHDQPQFQYKVERAMRLFYRLRYTHHRHMATHDSAIVDLNRVISNGSRLLPSQSVAGDPGVPAASAVEGNGAVFDAPTDEFEDQMVVEEEGDRAQVAVKEFRETVEHIDNPDNLYLNLRCAPLRLKLCDTSTSVHPLKSRNLGQKIFVKVYLQSRETYSKVT